MNRREKAEKSKRKRQQKRSVQKFPLSAKFTSPRDTLDVVRDRVARVLSGKGADVVLAAEAAGEEVDRQVEKAWARSSSVPACKRGCSFCCSGIRVEVTIPEVARIVQHARAKLPADASAAIEARAKSNAARTAGKSTDDYPARLDCALLGAEGECLVYEARPFMCRGEHSLDADQCKNGHETAQAGVPDTSHLDRDEDVRLTSQAAAMGAMLGMGPEGAPPYSYELQGALAIGMSAAGDAAAWLSDPELFAPALAVGQEEARDMLIQLSRKPGR